jgi:hypothetical protein
MHLVPQTQAFVDGNLEARDAALQIIRIQLVTKYPLALCLRRSSLELTAEGGLQWKKKGQRRRLSWP